MAGFRIGHALPLVLEMHRDGVGRFGPSLPGVEGIDEVENVERNGRSLRTRRWSIGGDALPRLLSRVIPPDFLSFVEISEWGDTEGTWRIVVPVLGEEPRMQGAHRFEVDGDGCRVEVEADLLAFDDIDSVLGIPVGNRTRRVMQSAVLTLFERMITASGWVVQRQLDEESASR